MYCFTVTDRQHRNWYIVLLSLIEFVIVMYILQVMLIDGIDHIRLYYDENKIKFYRNLCFLY
jgi:hypothetical protein